MPPPISEATEARTGLSLRVSARSGKRPEPRKRLEVGQKTATEPVSLMTSASRSDRWMQWPNRLFGPSRP
ncbi:hypothetical protein D9M72_556630 [compost metagenome]